MNLQTSFLGKLWHWPSVGKGWNVPPLPTKQVIAAKSCYISFTVLYCRNTIKLRENEGIKEKGILSKKHRIFSKISEICCLIVLTRKSLLTSFFIFFQPIQDLHQNIALFQVFSNCARFSQIFCILSRQFLLFLKQFDNFVETCKIC